MCMSMNRCRSHARGDSVVVNDEHMNGIIQVAKEVLSKFRES